MQTETNILKRVFNFQQVCEEAGKDPKEFELPENATDDDLADQRYRVARLIYKVLNEGKIPKYGEERWIAVFVGNPGSGFSFAVSRYGRTHSGVGVRLSAVSKPVADHIGKYFTKEIGEYMWD